ncbi:hypothetical protein AT574_11995 [Phaeobacter inhibens]|nr:hypothetical protein AT574_11995 [Phaeobacter inhibens]
MHRHLDTVGQGAEWAACLDREAILSDLGSIAGNTQNTTLLNDLFCDLQRNRLKPILLPDERAASAEVSVS